jgi:hypothetical protein
VTKKDKKTARLTAKQLKAIPFIVASSTIEEGCKRAKISRNTFYTWLQNIDFKAELRRQRDLVIEDALEILKSKITSAVNALLKLLDTTDNDSLKRLICNDIINHTMKSKELEDLDKRVGIIEELIKDRLK